MASQSTSNQSIPVCAATSSRKTTIGRDAQMANTSSNEGAVSVTEGSVHEHHILDDAILSAQGHEAAMPRTFSIMSALGLGFSITNSWVGYGTSFGQNLVYGGPQSVIFGLIVACLVQWTITLGLSELASAFPSSGGQYHFVFILTPEKHRHFAAFMIGWMSILACASGLSLAAVSIMGMVKFWNPDFVTKQWHVYLCYLAVAWFTASILFIAPKQMARITQLALYISILGFVVTFVTLLATQTATQPVSSITQPGLGTSGWSNGIAWMLGISNAMYAFGGTDGAIHIAEETSAPGKRLPQVMNLTILIGVSTALPLMVVMMLVMQDMEEVIASGLPIAQIYIQATQSKTITTVLMVFMLVVLTFAIPSQWITSGRISWAFARDNGMPCSKFFSHVDPKLKFPVRTTIASVIFVSLYGLFYLASTTAFNSIVTSAVLYLNITYAVPQGILLFRGREKSLPPRYLNLGRVGYFCNGFSIVWIGILGVLVCMPPELPVTVATMNYSSIVLVVLLTVILSFWFTIGNRFTGPRLSWDELTKLAETSVVKPF